MPYILSSERNQLYTSMSVDLVRRIRDNDGGGLLDLYRILSRSVRLFLARQVSPPDVEDKVHDVFIIVVGAIQRGQLRESEKLMGFVWGVVRRQIASHIGMIVQRRQEQLCFRQCFATVDSVSDTAGPAIAREKTDLMMTVLACMPSRDREILERFYLQEQTIKHICREMGLSETQFRLVKSRAKHRFEKLGKMVLSGVSG